MKNILIIGLLCLVGEGALADQNNCALQATTIVAEAQKKTKPMLVPVSKNICIDTETFSGFFIGDFDAWRIEITGRDANRKALGYRLTPLSNGLVTTLHLEQVNGTVSTFMLKSL